jgi:hypothetical protein
LKYLRDAGYFENSYRAGDGSWVNISLSEKSLQLVAGWPRPGDDLYDRLLTILEQRIHEAPTADEKSRAEKLRAALASAGRDLVVEVIGNVATKGLLTQRPDHRLGQNLPGRIEPQAASSARRTASPSAMRRARSWARHPVPAL